MLYYIKKNSMLNNLLFVASLCADWVLVYTCFTIKRNFYNYTKIVFNIDTILTEYELSDSITTHKI